MPKQKQNKKCGKEEAKKTAQRKGIQNAVVKIVVSHRNIEACITKI